MTGGTRPSVAGFGPVARIVSGGQAGVDRAALDFAVERGIAYGGWVPAGGWAEDLPEPPGLLGRYPKLTPTKSSDPAERTRRNVRDSDAVLVITQGSTTSPGTFLTIEEADRLGRPLLVVDLARQASRSETLAFLAGLSPRTTLDVAGPRESEVPGVYQATATFLVDLAEGVAD